MLATVNCENIQAVGGVILQREHVKDVKGMEGTIYPNTLVRNVVPDRTTGSFWGTSLTTMITCSDPATYVSNNRSTCQKKQIEIKI